MAAVELKEARDALDSLCELLKEHGDICDPTEIAENAKVLMAEVVRDVHVIVDYLDASDDMIRGLDGLSLRDLLLADETIMVEFTTVNGHKAELTVGTDSESPVTLSHDDNSRTLSRKWRKLTGCKEELLPSS